MCSEVLYARALESSLTWRRAVLTMTHLLDAVARASNSADGSGLWRVAETPSARNWHLEKWKHSKVKPIDEWDKFLVRVLNAVYSSHPPVLFSEKLAELVTVAEVLKVAAALSPAIVTQILDTPGAARALGCTRTSGRQQSQSSIDDDDKKMRDILKTVMRLDVQADDSFKDHPLFKAASDLVTTENSRTMELDEKIAHALQASNSELAFLLFVTDLLLERKNADAKTSTTDVSGTRLIAAESTKAALHKAVAALISSEHHNTNRESADAMLESMAKYIHLLILNPRTLANIEAQHHEKQSVAHLMSAPVFRVVLIHK